MKQKHFAGDPGISCGSTRLKAVVLPVLGVAGILVSSSVNSRDAAPLKAEQLAMVDCLLPAQVRQLGGMMTYLGPREPTKATASECEIRGGEYVAYDRANFATAFQVWLPKAKEGDAQAQTYVGEIYEKGMGMPSDYAKAAEWYRKAADQGFAKAQSNLAYLYEQGLGVQKDSVQALNLYRKASGIVDDDLTFASEVTSVRTSMQSQIDTLSEQLEDKTSAADALQKEVETTRTQISQQAAHLSAARRESEQLKARVTRLQAGTDSTASSAKLAELQQAQAELQTRQHELAEQEAALDALKRSSSGAEARLSDQLAAAAAEADKLRKQLGEQTAVAETARSQLAAANARVTTMDEQLRRLTADTNDARQRLASTQASLASAQSSPKGPTSAEVQALRERVAAGEQAVAALQVTRKQYEAQVATLNKTVAANQQQLQASRAQIASLEHRALEADQRLADANRKLIDQEQALASDRSKFASNQATAQEMRNFATRVAEQEAKLSEQRSQIAGLQAEKASYLKDIGTLKSMPLVAQASTAAAPVMRGGGTHEQLPPDVDLGNYHALIIGNDTYQNMPNLTTAISDADAVANVLRSKYGFETRVLHNATNDQIMGAINEYRKSLRDTDNLLIYYAGHGELDQKNYRGYWLPVNSKRDDTTAWISDQMITDQLNGMSARHVLVVADSCYAGAMTRSGGIELVSKGGDDAKRLRYLARSPSRDVLTSGGVAPVVDGGPGGNSVFASALVEALRRNDGVLEGAELYNQIFDVVRSAAKRLFKVDQSPVYAKIRDGGHRNGEFLFVPRAPTSARTAQAKGPVISRTVRAGAS